MYVLIYNTLLYLYRSPLARGMSEHVALSNCEPSQRHKEKYSLAHDALFVDQILNVKQRQKLDGVTWKFRRRPRWTIHSLSSQTFVIVFGFFFTFIIHSWYERVFVRAFFSAPRLRQMHTHTHIWYRLLPSHAGTHTHTIIPSICWKFFLCRAFNEASNSKIRRNFFCVSGSANYLKFLTSLIFLHFTFVSMSHFVSFVLFIMRTMLCVRVQRGLLASQKKKTRRHNENESGKNEPSHQRRSA